MTFKSRLSFSITAMAFLASLFIVGCDCDTDPDPVDSNDTGERLRTSARLVSYDNCSGLEADLKANLKEEMMVQLLPSMGAASPDGKMAGPAGNGARISGSVSRLVDPLTMLIYGETIHRRIDVAIDAPDQGTVMTTTMDQREYQYLYPAPM